MKQTIKDLIDISYYAGSRADYTQGGGGNTSVKNNENGEYVILKLALDADGEETLVTIENDEEFDEVADIFEDRLFEDIDYGDDQ